MSGNQQLQKKLNQGLSEINLLLTISQQNALLAYLALLDKWNQVYNLTAIRQLEQMLIYHLLDTLAVIPFIDDWNSSHTKALRILDVGSGGGLPGIPWALARPDWQLSLIDCVQKKTTFLTQVKMQLNIMNLRVITGHVEKLPNYISDTQFDIIVCRAFSSLEQFLTLAGSWLAPGGLSIALKGEYPSQELTALSDAWHVEAIHPITPISGLDAQRHVVLVSRKHTEKTKQG